MSIFAGILKELRSRNVAGIFDKDKQSGFAFGRPEDRDSERLL